MPLLTELILFRNFYYKDVAPNGAGAKELNILPQKNAKMFFNNKEAKQPSILCSFVPWLFPSLRSFAVIVF